MSSLKLRIITPNKIVLEKEILQITLPTSEGEITVLPNHIPLFSTLIEGVITIVDDKEESFLSIGGGYLETDGKTINILVSRAYGQDEIDEKEIELAKKEAEKSVAIAKTEEERQQALASLRRSTFDIKLLEKVKRRRKI